ncbi:MAG: dihydrolipoyl dehydrogenase [Gammaproteobacteria bacterium]|nr:dihydrolipoyl dehydrogenase [Gammaproteobacteria bacterium]
MAEIKQVLVPDIGDFDDIEIIEVLVAVGDEVSAESSIITLESDKAAMEIPTPHSGTVTELNVKVGDRVSEGSAILSMSVAESLSESEGATEEAHHAPAKPAASPTSADQSDADLHAEVLVLGSGPGGYTAAFRAADLGKKVILVERHARIGGVCLNVGCIPSKALLHTAQIINESQEMSEHGVTFGKPKVDLPKLAGFKDGVVERLTGGLAALAKQRKVTIVRGEGKFSSTNRLSVVTADGEQSISFDHAIVAVGSRSIKIPGFPFDDPRVWDSTDALELNNVPKRLLIVGGGIIGLEMATVYDALGSNITVVELGGSLIPGADKDIVRPLQRHITKRYENIMLDTKVVAMETQKDGIMVTFEGKKGSETDLFDAVLVSVGRAPNGLLIDAEKAGISVDERGFITTDKQMRTNVPHIFAIGDVVGQPMLAHKATHEAKVAAEVICGHDKITFDPLTIPSVAYTDPEVAWMGITEERAKAEGIEYEKGAFPWAASGRSLSIGRDDGLTKALFDKASGRIIGAGIVGPNAGELIAEAVLALELGADAEDISLTIHPHPTLSETLGFAAEIVDGSITDIMPPRKKR